MAVTLATCCATLCLAQSVGNTPDASFNDSAGPNLPRVFSRQGIEFPSSDRFVLAPPSLRGQLSDDERFRLLEDLAGRVGWERFSRDNLNAPISMDIQELTGTSETRLGLSVHSAYIIYATMERLRDQDLMQSTFGGTDELSESGGHGRATSMRQLEPAELEELGITELDDSEAYVWIELPLFRKVVIRGVVQLQKFETDRSVELYWQFDDRFSSPRSLEDDDDGETGRQPDTRRYQNAWSPLSTNELGALVEGAPRPYQGLAAYMSIFATGQQAGQWLVESRMAIYEPEEWFGGSNYLRSKLPLSVQEGAKSLRRKLR